MDVHHLVQAQPNPKVPSFRPGDTVRVNYIIREGDRVRSQAFQGVVIRKSGGTGAAASFTVRRISHNDIGVERSFPLFSPQLDSLEVLRRGKVRRARLYYLRGRFGRAARIKERTLRPGQRLAEAAAAAAAKEATPEVETPEAEETAEAVAELTEAPAQETEAAAVAEATPEGEAQEAEPAEAVEAEAEVVAEATPEVEASETDQQQEPSPESTEGDKASNP